MSTNPQTPNHITISPQTLVLALALAGAAFFAMRQPSAHAEPASAVAPTVLPVVISTQPVGNTSPGTINLSLDVGSSVGGNDDRPPGAATAPATAAAEPSGTVPARAASIESTDTAGASRVTSQANNRVANEYSTTQFVQYSIVDNGVTVDGDGVVVARDGAILQVGDNGQLTGNTGDVSTGGVVGLDVDGSTLQSGTASLDGVTDPGSSSDSAAAATHQLALNTPAASPAPLATVPPVTANPSSGWHLDIGDLVRTAQTGANGFSMSISGYEDHSITVGGDDNLITYDDANAFIGREGRINANTGDTDSSGLNVVDAVDSTIRSGNSGDGEGAGDEDGDDLASSWVEQELAAESSGRADGDDEDPQGGGTNQLTGPLSPTSAMVRDDDGETAANGASALVIGGDGFDDVAVRVAGSRNIVTYDDSNVVVGGRGDVNAQIGDSDTGGTVAMGVRGTTMIGGCEGDLCPLYTSTPNARR